MGRIKTKDWEPANYSLEVGIKDTIKEIAQFEGMSASEMVGFLAKNWDAGINPANKLNMLLNDRENLKNQMDNIDDKIKDLTKQIKMFDIWKKQKSGKKHQAIMILKRHILNKEFEDTERLARVWQGMTGIPAIELIAEASEGLQRSGV